MKTELEKAKQRIYEKLFAKQLEMQFAEIARDEARRAINRWFKENRQELSNIVDKVARKSLAKLLKKEMSVEVSAYYS